MGVAAVQPLHSYDIRGEKGVRLRQDDQVYPAGLEEFFQLGRNHRFLSDGKPPAILRQRLDVGVGG